MVPVVDASILEQLSIKARTVDDVSLHANAHYLADQVVAEGARLGFEKVWVEPEILGTAGPLRRIYAEGYRGGLLVMNGDAYCHFDLRKFVEEAKLRASNELSSSGCCGVTLLAIDFPKVNTFRVGKDGRLNGVVGRFGSEEGTPATFSGISYYSDEALSRIADNEFDIRKFWMQELEAGRPPFVDMSQKNATWIDMGSPEGLMDAMIARLDELGVNSWESDRLTVDRERRSIVFAGASVAEGEIVENEIRGKDFIWKVNSD